MYTRLRITPFDAIGVDATPPSGSGDGKVRPTKESTAKDLRTKGDEDVGYDLESNQKSSDGLGSEAEIRRGGGMMTYESSTGRRVLVLRKSFSRHRPGCCRPLLSPTNPLRTSTGVISLMKMNNAQGSKYEKNRLHRLHSVPKVMIVGSGTFNPVHMLHIRRFNLARDFLEGHKGVSCHFTRYSLK